MLAHFLCHEEHQTFRQDGYVVVYECITCVFYPFGTQVSHFNNEMLEVQQLLLLHVGCRVHFVLLQIFFELVDSFSENGHFVRFGSVLEADSPHQGRTVFDERDGEAHLQKTYFLQSGGLLQVIGLLAKGEALSIQLHQVSHYQCMFYVNLENSSRF